MCYVELFPLFYIMFVLLLYLNCIHFVVMILGALLANKKYPLIKYLCVLLIVIGVALFLYKDVSTMFSSYHYTFSFIQFLSLFNLYNTQCNSENI